MKTCLYWKLVFFEMCLFIGHTCTITASQLLLAHLISLRREIGERFDLCVHSYALRLS